MSGLFSFVGILLALVCMTLPQQIAPRLWFTLALASVALTVAGIVNFPR